MYKVLGIFFIALPFIVVIGYGLKSGAINWKDLVYSLTVGALIWGSIALGMNLILR